VAEVRRDLGDLLREAIAEALERRRVK